MGATVVKKPKAALFDVPLARDGIAALVTGRKIEKMKILFPCWRLARFADRRPALSEYRRTFFSRSSAHASLGAIRPLWVNTP
jgi:hypothetical protein